MRKSGRRILSDIAGIRSELFAEICRNGRSNVFVRSRKMPLDDLAFSMINRRGLTLKLELRGFMNISRPGTQISKPGYLKQRMKMNPEAFAYLFHFHNKNFYSDPEEQESHLKNDYKHRMTVNHRTLCIGLLKNDLIYVLLEKDPKVQEKLMQNLYEEISENIVPVRPDRHYTKTKGQLAGNYSNTHKRSY